MSEEDAVSSVVAALLKARKTGQPALFEKLADADLTVDEAFRVQELVATVIGPVGAFKVGNKPGASQIMAPIFAKDILSGPATINCPPNEDIGIELEVGFRVDRPLPDRNCPGRREAIAHSVSAVIVIELVRTRLTGEASPNLKLADNQINGGLVVGTPVSDWHGLPMSRIEAALRIGEEDLLCGEVDVPGGDAFDNFLALEQMVGDHCGGLQPGQVVITGSLNGLPYVRAETEVRGTIKGLGEISLRLNAAV